MNHLADGAQAEQLAAAYLERHGLRAVERNYRCRQGEIDLILHDGGTLVFVEVRLRKSAAFGGAAASITAKKQRRIVLAAEHYLQGLKRIPPCRFDVVLLDGLAAQSVEWIKDAFSA
ncbi:MAG: YraN family protein [Sulfuricella sp.]|nr:YraN family protein [Sulfuricella sp.]